MFIILVTFKKSREALSECLAEHRLFLDECYKKNHFIASGKNNIGTGGVIISQLTDKAHLEEVISEDPLYIKDIAEYKLIEFTPTKYHQAFSEFIENKGIE